MIPTKTSFNEQKWNAKRRDIPWQLTFEQWSRIWSDSGKLDRRGYRKGNYVMARFGDTGSYAIGNVEVILAEDNNRAANNGRKRTRRNKNNISQGIKAYWTNLTPEQRAERGRKVSAGQRKSGGLFNGWKDEARRKRQARLTKQRWAKLSPRERTARGKAISKAKRHQP
jgi:hypothetical protein